jgi:hypothetical protein
MSPLFVECEGGKWVNLAHVAVIIQHDFPDEEHGVARFELLGPDKSRLGFCVAGSFNELIAEAAP